MNNLIFRVKNIIEKNEIKFFIILVLLILSAAILLESNSIIGISIICFVSLVALIKLKILKGDIKLKVEYPSLGEYIIAKKSLSIPIDNSSYHKMLIKDNKYQVWSINDDEIYLSDKYQNYFFINYFQYKDYFISISDLRDLKLDKILR